MTGRGSDDGFANDIVGELHLVHVIHGDGDGHVRSSVMRRLQRLAMYENVDVFKYVVALAFAVDEGDDEEISDAIDLHDPLAIPREAFPVR